MHNRSALISQRLPAAVDPAVGAVRTAHAVLHGKGLAGGEGVAHRFHQAG